MASRVAHTELYLLSSCPYINPFPGDGPSGLLLTKERDAMSNIRLWKSETPTTNPHPLCLFSLAHSDERSYHAWAALGRGTRGKERWVGFGQEPVRNRGDPSNSTRGTESMQEPHEQAWNWTFFPTEASDESAISGHIVTVALWKTLNHRTHLTGTRMTSPTETRT